VVPWAVWVPAGWPPGEAALLEVLGEPPGELEVLDELEPPDEGLDEPELLGDPELLGVPDEDGMLEVVTQALISSASVAGMTRATVRVHTRNGHFVVLNSFIILYRRRA